MLLPACRTALPDALAALLEVPPDSTWDRLLPSLLDGLGGLGPSHRATAHLLAALPASSNSSRCTLLKQWAALQLAARLMPGAPKQVRACLRCWGGCCCSRVLPVLWLTLAAPPRWPDQAPPSRGASSRSVLEVKAGLADSLLGVLGSKDAARKLVALVDADRAGAGDKRKAKLEPEQAARVLSILEAADLLLWADVSAPGGLGCCCS